MAPLTISHRTAKEPPQPIDPWRPSQGDGIRLIASTIVSAALIVFSWSGMWSCWKISPG